MNRKPTLAEYLEGNNLNISIYKLLKAEHPDLFDYYEFFNFLYQWFDFFQEHQDNYYRIETEFSKIETEGLERYVFFHYLIEVIKYYYYTGKGEEYDFTPAGYHSFGYIVELFNEIKEEFPEQEEVIAESPKTNANTSQLQEKTLVDYLEDDFNITFYQELVEAGDWTDTFEPKEFLDRLYSEYDFFVLNRGKYLTIKEHFDAIEFDGYQEYYFLGSLLLLIDHLDSVVDFTGVTLRSYKYIRRLLAAIDNPFPTEGELDAPNPHSTVIAEQLKSISPETDPLDGFKNSQLVLIFYYFLKNSGLELRKEIDVAPVAKFMHLITGRDFKGTTSSDFYQKLLKAPNFKKTEKGTIEDLETIKPLFQKVQLNEIVATIDKEIGMAKSESSKPKK